MYVATVFLCNIVGNNAAAALMYPIAAGASERVGIDRDQMAYLLMLAASASFMRYGRSGLSRIRRHAVLSLTLVTVQTDHGDCSDRLR